MIIPFYITMIVVCVLGISLFLTFFLYLLNPKHKLPWVVILVPFLVIGFWLSFYFLYHPLPGTNYGIYPLVKAAYIEHFGLLFGFVLAIPFLFVFAFCSWLAKRAADKKSLEFQDSRRTLLRTAAVAVPLMTMGGSAVAAYHGEKELLITHEHFMFHNLPSFLKDYKIAQISDVHIGAFIDMDDFDQVMQKVLKEKPNRLFITGDLIDDISRLSDLQYKLRYYAEFFPDGIDYIYGNHEHYRDYKAVKKALEDTPIHIMDNESIRIHGGDEPVYLVGVNYDMTRTEASRRTMLDKAMKQVPEHAFVILLAHHPENFDLAIERRIPLTVCGHTHGGQMVIAGQSLVPVGTPYFKGRYDHGDSSCYVNSGAGHWYPVRINCPREVTFFTFGEK